MMSDVSSTDTSSCFGPFIFRRRLGKRRDIAFAFRSAKYREHRYVDPPIAIATATSSTGIHGEDDTATTSALASCDNAFESRAWSGADAPAMRVASWADAELGGSLWRTATGIAKLSGHVGKESGVGAVGIDGNGDGGGRGGVTGGGGGGGGDGGGPVGGEWGIGGVGAGDGG